MKRQGPHIAIIGAGVVGLCCALALARRGAKVSLIEAAPAQGGDGRWFGLNGASVRAAGMLGAYSEGLMEPDGAHPQAMALRAAGLRAWRDFAVSLEAGADIGGPYGGCLVVTAKPDRLDALARLVAGAQSMGARAELWDAAEARRAEPALAEGVLGAALFRDEGQMSPAPALGAIADACAELGVRCIRGTAIAVERSGARRVVRLEDGGRVDADGVALTPGAFAPETLWPFAPSLARLTTAGGTVITAKGLRMSRTVRADDVYIAVGADGLARIGGGMRACVRDNQLDEAAKVMLLRAAQAAFPGAAGEGGSLREKVISAQAGVRPMSPDAAPLIGRDGVDGALAAIGHGRNGWLLGPLTGQIISAYVFDDPIAPLWAAFAPQRFDKP
jgi:glycine oxidase